MSWALGDDSPTIKGVITGAEYTNVLVNDREVWEYFYTFASPETGEWFGSSYTSELYPNTGDTVAIQYDANDPSISRIQGMDTSISGTWLALVLGALFIIDMLVLRFFVSMNKEKLNILNRGKLTRGIIVAHNTTGTVIYNQPVSALTFAYGDNRKKYRTTTKTHEVDEVLDEQEEYIVYDRDEPSRGVVVDALPSIAANFIRKNWA